jgi:uncharacterized protein with GYD domain
MPTYMFKGSYSREGLEGVRKDGGSARVKAAETLASSVGGTLKELYFAFGGVDFYAIADLPDNVSAAALATTIGASGAMSHLETVVLLTPAEVDAAVGTSATYRPPGH